MNTPKALLLGQHFPAVFAARVVDLGVNLLIRYIVTISFLHHLELRLHQLVPQGHQLIALIHSRQVELCLFFGWSPLDLLLNPSNFLFLPGQSFLDLANLRVRLSVVIYFICSKSASSHFDISVALRPVDLESEVRLALLFDETVADREAVGKGVAWVQAQVPTSYFICGCLPNIFID